MTKKRFVKLLMSQGVQRNEAHEIAGRYNARSYAYADAFRDFVLKTSITKSFERLGGAMRKATIKIKYLAAAFEEFRERMIQNDKL